MAVPGYQEFMFPILKYMYDGKEYHRKDIYENIAIAFKFTDEQLEEMLPSGKLVYKDRIGWALSYIKQANLVRTTKRACYCITDEGKKLVDKNFTELDTKYLYDNYPAFAAFKNAHKKETNKGTQSPTNVAEIEEKETPFEKIVSSANIIKTTICSELLTKILEQTPFFFEQLVVDLLLAMGYGNNREDAGSATKKTGDGGIDGLIKEDKLGLDTIYLQAKRYQIDNVIGRPVVQQFAGALLEVRAKKGVFITTSRFSKEAIQYASNQQQATIILIDGEKLVDLMYEYNVGVSPEKTFTIKKVDYDYFE